MSASDGEGDAPSREGIASEVCRFAADAGAVIWLRSLRLAGGGRPALREAALMVAEKCHGHAAYARALAGGRFGFTPRSLAAGTLAYYGLWVRDNRARLSQER